MSLCNIAKARPQWVLWKLSPLCIRSHQTSNKVPLIEVVIQFEDDGSKAHWQLNISMNSTSQLQLESYLKKYDHTYICFLYQCWFHVIQFLDVAKTTHTLRCCTSNGHYRVVFFALGYPRDQGMSLPDDKIHIILQYYKQLPLHSMYQWKSQMLLELNLS